MSCISAGFCGRAQPRPPAAGDTSEARVFRRSRNGLRPIPRLAGAPPRKKAGPEADPAQYLHKQTITFSS